MSDGKKSVLSTNVSWEQRRASGREHNEQPLSHFSRTFADPLPFGDDHIKEITATRGGTFIAVVPGRDDESYTSDFLRKNHIRLDPTSTTFFSKLPSGEHVASKQISTYRIPNAEAIKLYGLMLQDGALTPEVESDLVKETRQIIAATAQHVATSSDSPQPSRMRARWSNTLRGWREKLTPQAQPLAGGAEAEL